MALAKSFEKVRRLFSNAYSKKNLLTTNILASGGLLFLGDFIQQNLELRKGTSKTGLLALNKNYPKFSDSFDYSRSCRMLAMGLFHGAPRHFFYQKLEKLIPGTR